VGPRSRRPPASPSPSRGTCAQDPKPQNAGARRHPAGSPPGSAMWATVVGVEWTRTAPSGAESPRRTRREIGTRQGPEAGLANRRASATFCCGGVGALCGGDTQSPGQSSFGAVKPPRSCRFLLMQDSCGLSIGMPNGGVALRSARQRGLHAGGLQQNASHPDAIQPNKW